MPITLEDAVRELVKEYGIACEKLTKNQLASAICQALKCGDFVRYVTVDGLSQKVVYQPWSECERLRARINELEHQLMVIPA